MHAGAKPGASLKTDEATVDQTATINMNKAQMIICELVRVHKNVHGQPTPFGTFRYRYAHQMEWTEVVVSISPILFSRMFGKGKAKDKLFPTNSYEGHQYCAPRRPVTSERITSRERTVAYNKCPFNLVLFQPIKGSDIPANCLLEAVDEAYTPPIFDELSNHLIGYEKGFKALGEWCRHTIQTTESMMTDNLFKKIRPVKPKHYPVLGNK